MGLKNEPVEVILKTIFVRSGLTVNHGEIPWLSRNRIVGSCRSVFYRFVRVTQEEQVHYGKIVS